jgi:hypothetical protein
VLRAGPHTLMISGMRVIVMRVADVGSSFGSAPCGRAKKEATCLGKEHRLPLGISNNLDNGVDKNGLGVGS